MVLFEPFLRVVAQAGYQNITGRCLIAHISYCLYLCSSYKFHRLQVQNGTFGAMSQVEKLGLVGLRTFQSDA